MASKIGSFTSFVGRVGEGGVSSVVGFLNAGGSAPEPDRDGAPLIRDFASCNLVMELPTSSLLQPSQIFPAAQQVTQENASALPTAVPIMVSHFVQLPSFPIGLLHVSQRPGMVR